MDETGFLQNAFFSFNKHLKNFTKITIFKHNYEFYLSKRATNDKTFQAKELPQTLLKTIVSLFNLNLYNVTLSITNIH